MKFKNAKTDVDSGFGLSFYGGLWYAAPHACHAKWPLNTQSKHDLKKIFIGSRADYRPSWQQNGDADASNTRIIPCCHECSTIKGTDFCQWPQRFDHQTNSSIVFSVWADARPHSKNHSKGNLLFPGTESNSSRVVLGKQLREAPHPLFSFLSSRSTVTV